MSRLADFHEHLATILGIPKSSFSLSLHNDGTVGIDEGSTKQLVDAIATEKPNFDFGAKSDGQKKAEALDRLIQAEVVKGE